MSLAGGDASSRGVPFPDRYFREAGPTPAVNRVTVIRDWDHFR